MTQEARFVVGGVYRRPKANGGYQMGTLISAVEEPTGRIHGRMTVGGEADMTVSAKDMSNWELVSEPGKPLIAVGPKYVTDEDVRVAVDSAVSAELLATRDRLVELEAKLIQVVARLRDLEHAPEPQARPDPAKMSQVDGLKQRARA